MGMDELFDEVDDEIGGGFRTRRNGVWFLLIGIGLAGYGSEIDNTLALMGGVVLAMLGLGMIGVHRIPAELRKARANRIRRAEALRERVRQGRSKPRSAGAAEWKAAKAAIRAEHAEKEH